MALSESERQALRDRAAGLRAEMSSHNAARDNAITEASRNHEDMQLLKEVAVLERQVESARVAREAAEVNVNQAAAIMDAAAATGVVTPTVSAPEAKAKAKSAPTLQADLGGEGK